MVPVSSFQATCIGFEHDWHAESLKIARSRLWVVQECALAQENTCFCGSSQLDLLDVTRVAAWLVHNYYFVDADLRLQCSYAADMNDLVDGTYGFHRAGSGNPASLLYLLDLAQQRLSSEAVDKIYGILGLAATAKGQSRLDIKPDYSKAASDVFREVAWCLIRDDGDLQVLDYVRHWTTADGQLQLGGFPSWVPKWHEAKDLSEHPNFMALSFDACLGRKTKLKSNHLADPGILAVAGIKVDTVMQTTGRMQFSEDVNRAQSLAILLDRVHQMVPKGVSNNSETMDLSIATSLVAGVDVHFKPAGQEILHGYNAFRSSVERGVLPSPISEMGTRSAQTSQSQVPRDETSLLASHFGEAMSNACMNRSFFVTRSGYFGLGPHFIAPGDVVAILYGLQYPAILRRRNVSGNEEGGGDEYVFLGTSYVYGLMNGEVLRERNGRSAEDDIFKIR